MDGREEENAILSEKEKRKEKKIRESRGAIYVL